MPELTFLSEKPSWLLRESHLRGGGVFFFFGINWLQQDDWGEATAGRALNGVWTDLEQKMGVVLGHLSSPSPWKKKKII